jgi:hypothetical protein
MVALFGDRWPISSPLFIIGLSHGNKAAAHGDGVKMPFCFWKLLALSTSPLF